VSAPKLGDYIVFRTDGWAARFIQLGTLSRKNHAAVYVGNGKIVEAQPGGARVSNLSDYPVGTYDWSRLPMTEWQRVKVASAAQRMVGTPYGWWDIAMFALAAADVHIGWITAQAKDRHDLVCSQLVAYAYSDAGLHLGDCEPYQLTPGDLANLIESDHYLGGTV
jgi:uncharacterized protein YycO